jgi:hypothetical protein
MPPPVRPTRWDTAVVVRDRTAGFLCHGQAESTGGGIRAEDGKILSRKLSTSWSARVRRRCFQVLSEFSCKDKGGQLRVGEDMGEGLQLQL